MSKITTITPEKYSIPGETQPLKSMLPYKAEKTGRAGVPSGASTGAREAVELRDNDKKRYSARVLPAWSKASSKPFLLR
jgi:enolase